MTKPIIGWREWVALPGFGVDRIKAKIDTGARTSALHAFDIHLFQKEGQEWVRFAVHPLQKNDRDSRTCACPVHDVRTVTNSGGGREERIVIKTTLSLGGKAWPIEITLTNRDQMGFRMLLGRTAIRQHYLVHPGKSFCLEQ
ncbi:MAG: ATP-dependent zinc protease [Nitrospirales bacterium]|nr:ATP-dependent zinc protease [Nitrospira sp.]MDR4502184.1 ATP-dependent zinc protease [Nitrospirales bacterium]